MDIMSNQQPSESPLPPSEPTALPARRVNIGARRYKERTYRDIHSQVALGKYLFNGFAALCIRRPMFRWARRWWLRLRVKTDSREGLQQANDHVRYFVVSKL
jgi:hypothetical protein